MSSRLPMIELFGPTLQGEGLLLGKLTHFLRLGGCTYNCTWCDSMHAVDPQQIKQNRKLLSPQEIVELIAALPKAPWLTLTGGDPCIHKDLDDIFPGVYREGMRIAVETQGEIFPDWLKEVDIITFSPKGPSSGNITDIDAFMNNVDDLQQKHPGIVGVKVVVFDEADFDYAVRLYKRLIGAAVTFQQFAFQVGSPLNAEIPPMMVDGTTAQLLEGIEREVQEAHNKIAVHKIREQWKVQEVLRRYRWLTARVLSCSHMFDKRVTVTPQQHALLWPLEEKGR